MVTWWSRIEFERGKRQLSAWRPVAKRKGLLGHLSLWEGRLMSKRGRGTMPLRSVKTRVLLKMRHRINTIQ